MPTPGETMNKNEKVAESKSTAQQSMEIIKPVAPEALKPLVDKNQSLNTAKELLANQLKDQTNKVADKPKDTTKAPEKNMNADNKQEAAKDFLQKNKIPANYEGFIHDLGKDTEQATPLFNKINEYLKNAYPPVNGKPVSLGSLADFKRKSDDAPIDIGNNSTTSLKAIYANLVQEQKTDIKNKFWTSEGVATAGKDADFDKNMNSENIGLGEMYALNALKENEGATNNLKNKIEDKYIKNETGEDIGYIKDFATKIKEDAAAKAGMNQDSQGINMLEDIIGKKIDTTTAKRIAQGENFNLKTIDYRGIEKDSKNLPYLMENLQNQYPYASIQSVKFGDNGTSGIRVAVTVESVNKWYGDQKTKEYKQIIDTNAATAGKHIDFTDKSDPVTLQNIVKAIDNKNIPSGVTPDHIAINNAVLQKFNKNNADASKKYAITYTNEHVAKEYPTLDALKIDLNTRIGAKDSVGILFAPVQTKKGYAIVEYTPTITDTKSKATVSKVNEIEDLFR